MEKLVLNSENKEKLQKKILKLESNDSDNNSNKVDLNLTIFITPYKTNHFSSYPFTMKKKIW